MTPEMSRDRLYGVPPRAAQPLLAVLSDFVTVGGPTGTLRFYGPATNQYQSFINGEPPPAEDEVLGVTDTHSFRLAVGDDAAELAVRAAAVLQDDVMDDLGAPWPEVGASGESSVVLEPVVGETGVGEWKGDRLTCLIGELHQVFGPMLVHS
jgi:hypothetical protein